ncbi:MAG: TrmH family RNA methyltransferase [Victivallales bacterium]
MKKNPVNDITIILDRLRSAHNTGNIFRLADAVGAKEIICCGYTPFPPHPKLAKTAMGADTAVAFRHFEDSFSAVEEIRKEGARQILAVETGPGGICAWEKNYEFPLGLVFGNEALGISPETISICDGIVNLPMFGIKGSINVGNCAAVVLYSVLARSKNKRNP